MKTKFLSSRIRLRVVILSIVMGILILGLKYYAYLVSGSTALKSDAIESVVNVIAAFFALGAVIFADKPADKDHPYGHGKIEHFSAAFEGGLITLAAVLIDLSVHPLSLFADLPLNPPENDVPFKSEFPYLADPH